MITSSPEPYSMGLGEFVSEPQYSEILARLDYAESRCVSLGETLKQQFSEAELRTRTTHDPETGISTLLLILPTLVDVTHSLVVSEIAHQLRSALDNLVFHLLRGHERDPDVQKRLGFPIAVDRKSFKNALDGGSLAGASRDLVEEIWQMQPFHDAPPPRAQSPSAPLGLLHDINRFDKHRFLPLAVSRAVGRIEPKHVEVVPLTEYTECNPFMVFNDDVEGVNEIPIFGVQAKPRSARFQMTVTETDVLPFNVVFGSERRFDYEDLCDMVGAVHGTCKRLSTKFGDKGALPALAPKEPE